MLQPLGLLQLPQIQTVHPLPAQDGQEAVGVFVGEILHPRGQLLVRLVDLEQEIHIEEGHAPLLQHSGKVHGVLGDGLHVQLRDDIGHLAVIQAVALVDLPPPQQALHAAV